MLINKKSRNDARNDSKVEVFSDEHLTEKLINFPTGLFENVFMMKKRHLRSSFNKRNERIFSTFDNRTAE